ncbi:MAG TPA: AMP-binding protein, partial [Longimicrobium sp.]|nr:AMP-binding protein [Longimicrobium sp.]
WVPVNTRLRGAGAAYVVERSRPRLLVVQRELEEVVRGASGRAPLVWLDEIDATPREGEQPGRTPSAPGDALCVMYTSGTTGAPKGVVFSHRMMRIAGESVLTVADARRGDRLFLWEPLCHIGGAQVLVAPFLERVELHLAARFSASRIWDQLVAARATHLHYLGGVLDILMQLPPERQPARHDLRVVWGAGVSARAWRGIEERLGVAIRECYGMTECSSFATFNAAGTPGSIGRPLPWLSLELLDEEGRTVKAGEIGEIVLSSRVEGAFLSSYLDDPAATGAALRGGKLHTGDSARADAGGDLYFVGRRTDSMRVRGENVSAWEIERIFATHPAVAASAAVGVPGEVGEQEILLYVQFEPGAAETVQDLARWAEGQLASFQLPRYYASVEAFETTPSQRVRKHLLPRTPGAAWDRAGGRRS